MREFECAWVVPEPSADEAAQPASLSVHRPPTSADAHPELTSKMTEIYLPSMIAHDRKVVVEGLGPGNRYHYDESRLSIEPTALTPGQIHRVSVKAELVVNSFWDDFGTHVVPAFVLVFSFLVAIVLVKLSETAWSYM
ncbi:uncharacterized protein B0H18DRAFT_1122807 [Fomitopsis serialis]|uniref:uncharacterized protein n=1 Tax=Fomitopsis serialis TaxID=139415 RepID=UPI0020088FA5|nr:uncharacterized protein B0H18DRAFT_1122807 [Neoantrodia serialis]KAH9918833.1 hypothetical protein B0H18DRAFT_1122807 [Neoantrodia serialis]